MQVPRYLNDCAEDAEEEIEDATAMLLLDFTEEESGRLLVDWEDEAGETDEPALHFTWHSCPVPYCFAQTPVHLSMHPVKGKQHHATTLLTELAELDGGGREEERTLETAEEGTEEAAELAGEEEGVTEEVEENEDAEEDAELTGQLIPAWCLQSLSMPLHLSSVQTTPSSGQAVPFDFLLSAGQVTVFPVHFSSTSQEPTEARQTVDEGANVSAGHVAEVPGHVSATSQVAVDVRQTVVLAANLQSFPQQGGKTPFTFSHCSPALITPLPQAETGQSAGHEANDSPEPHMPLPQPIMHSPLLLHLPSGGVQGVLAGLRLHSG